MTNHSVWRPQFHSDAVAAQIRVWEARQWRDLGTIHGAVTADAAATPATAHAEAVTAEDERR